ncbi:Cyclin-dependent kinases regulatory subunit [Plasmodium coatneyi]|uniref:Cyclin-dependent kinases regulatory subunit n=1 Tax=Plasmodium coatneyi TaxID=208452 RepID=A0A1B1DXN1_9APIC|nr:Cyclin-dependent kinases regulatory subunit [Plasmodium coatneyi]ANQ07500.1 Cyclin-dependent kinases regulatory subunit [Plasmodium coatneyi]
MTRSGGTPLNRPSREKSNEKNGSKRVSKGKRKSNGVRSRISSSINSRVNANASATDDHSPTNVGTDNPTSSSPKSVTNGNAHDDYYAILEELAKSETPKFRSVKDSMDENLNLEFLRSSSENYTYKITSRGPVCYSALYRDDKYVYRHIILSDNVRQYAESKVRKTNAFLTEHCIVNELQIDIGKGWKHFMIYDGKIRELILRKVLTAEDKLRMAVQAQKYN